MNFEQPGNSLEWIVFLAKKYSNMFIEGTWLTLYIAVIGTIVGFITQKPSELSKTALSQCSNFIVLRLFFPDDLKIVSGMSSNVTEETLEQIKTLHPGMGLVFGTAFKIPLLAGFPLPNPLPVSTSLDVSRVWYED